MWKSNDNSFFFFLNFSYLYSYEKGSLTDQNTSKERNEKNTRTATVLSVFNLQDAQHAAPPPSRTPKKPATRTTRRGSRRAPSPRALTSRSSHQHRGAGSEVSQATSAGEPPQARSAPDLRPAPQILHLHATLPHLHRLESSPPAGYTHATIPPSPPEKATEGG